MAATPATPDPDRWVQLLTDRLQAKRRSRWLSTFEGPIWVPGVDLLWNYFDGEPRLPVGADNAREAYRTFLRQSRTNLAENIVESVRDLMQPLGFRTGAAGDDTGDEEAWRIWQANGLDADSAIAHRYQLACREGFVMVGPVDPDTDEPLITVEDPRQAIVAWDPANRRRIRAGLKWYVDDDLDVERAHLTWREDPAGPGRPTIWTRTAIRTRTALEAGVTGTPGQWQWDGEPQQLVAAGGEPLRRVPMVRLVARPDALGRGRCEFEKSIDILDRINTQVLNRLVTVVMQTFRQRALLKDEGVELPDVDPKTGENIDYDKLFESTPAALWDLPAGVKIWESQLTDLQPIIAAVQQDLELLSAATRTPMYSLIPEGANQSAEGAQLAREGRTAKVVDRTATAGEAWESAMALAFEWKGDQQRSRVVDTELIWAAPEQYTLGEKAQAMSQVGDGLPWKAKLEAVMQLSPQQIARYREERAEDLLLAPDVTTPAPATGRTQPVPLPDQTPAPQA